MFLRDLNRPGDHRLNCLLSEERRCRQTELVSSIHDTREHSPGFLLERAHGTSSTILLIVGQARRLGGYGLDNSADYIPNPQVDQVL